MSYRLKRVNNTKVCLKRTPRGSSRYQGDKRLWPYATRTRNLILIPHSKAPIIQPRGQPDNKGKNDIVCTES